ncbi:MAG: 3-isopropylmalate dehydrogenase [Streptosporangiaceae bacterium]
MSFHIVALPGDGIGPEIVGAAVKLLRAVGSFEFSTFPFGAASIKMAGRPLTDEARDACRAADAILAGAVGTHRQSTDPDTPRPGDGLLELRADLGLYANIRPVRAWPTLAGVGPFRAETVRNVDLVIVRELTGGLYAGRRGTTGTGRDRRAFDTCTYTAGEIERVARVAFDLARLRGCVHGCPGRIASIDKANVLATSRLWREVVAALAETEFSDVDVQHLLVDSAVMALVSTPRRFDVMLTENMFGDILSDAAAPISGSLGMLPSASLADSPTEPEARPLGGLFEPVHGSAPDIAGQNVANPYGTFLSTALLLRYGVGLPTEAAAVEAAVSSSVAAGVHTPDIGGIATTTEVTQAVLDRLE